MNWLICNVCLQRPVNGVKTFSVTSCFHLLCDNCISPADSVCAKCKQACSVIQLNSSTPESVRDLFNDVSAESVASLEQVLDLQETQRSSMLSFYKELFKKYKLVKETLVKNERNANILWHKYQNSKAENAALKRKLQAYEEQQAKYQSTPIPHQHQTNNYSPLNVYSQMATPRRVPLNLNTSVFVTPDSMSSKTSSRSGGSGNSTPHCWGPKIADPSAYPTPKPTHTVLNTPRFM